MKEDVINIQTQLTGMYQQVTQSVVEYTPRVIGAIIMLIIGWLIAHAVRLVVRAIVARCDHLFRKMAKSQGIEENIHSTKETYANVISRSLFWIVILFFLAAATNVLGWQMATHWMASLISYLPNFIAGLLIVFVGFIIGNIAKDAVTRACHTAKFAHGCTLACGVKYIVVLTAVIVGVEQAGIDVDFISTIVTVVLGLTLAGAAFAFSLGGKTLAANILGAQYAKKHCNVGDNLQCGEISGRLLEITNTSLVIETGRGGRVIVPAKVFHDNATVIQ